MLTGRFKGKSDESPQRTGADEAWSRSPECTRPIRARRVKQSEVRTEMCRDLIPFSNKSAATPADATRRGARGWLSLSLTVYHQLVLALTGLPRLHLISCASSNKLTFQASLWRAQRSSCPKNTLIGLRCGLQPHVARTRQQLQHHLALPSSYYHTTQSPGWCCLDRITNGWWQ
jgi:hypothetical protein